jgi:hypothetical protein
VPVAPVATSDATAALAAAAGNERALLAADVGMGFTTVFLIEPVEGERRLIATGRVPSIGDDGRPAVASALERALARTLEIAGRPLHTTAAAERLVMTSAGGVPRIAIVAPRAGDGRALAAALAALPVRLLPVLALEGPAGEPEPLLASLEAQEPDLVLVHAGRPADHERVLGAIETLACGTGRLGAPPAVLVIAEDERVLASAAEALGPRLIPFQGSPAEQLAPAVRSCAAQRLGRGYLETLPEAWRAAPQSTLDGICAATELIAERYDVDVLTLDLGAAHALAVAAVGSQAQRRVVVAARDDLGLGAGRLSLLRQAGAAAVARWLPVDAGEELLRRAAQRALGAPASLPETVHDLLIEHAFAREALRLVAEDVAGRLAGTLSPALAAWDDAGGRSTPPPLPPIDLLIGSGGPLARVPRLIQAVLILLDAVQPEALTQLALDRATALALCGHLAATPAGLGAALERDGLLNLGLCIAPVGIGREGELALKVEVAYASRSPVAVEVPFGAIEVVPLPLGERAALKLWPSRELDVGLGRGNAATPRAEIEGGAVGIVIDCRGRPLVLPEAPEKRQAKLLQWLMATRAYPPLSFVEPPAAHGPA